MKPPPDCAENSVKITPFRRCLKTIPFFAKKNQKQKSRNSTSGINCGYLLLLFIFCVAFSFAFRTFVCNREISRIHREVGDKFAPFFVESAIMYAYSRDVADGIGIPKHDSQLVGTKPYRTCEQMSLGLEYFLGWGIRLGRLFVPALKNNQNPGAYEDNPATTAWMRGQIRLWTCLTSGIVFLWLIWLGAPWFFALLGGLLHGVTPAAVARHTGQDILRGEFGLPFIAAAFALFQLALRRKNPVWPLLMGIMVFCSSAFWDATQLVFGIWGCFELLRYLRGITPETGRRNLYIVIYIAQVLAAMLVPYNLAHGVILSPVIIAVWPTLLLVSFLKPLRWKRRMVIVALVSILSVAVWQAVSFHSSFADNYRHFRRLAIAKLVHLNVKPANPDFLDFEQRFLWTPGLDSATWQGTKSLYPVAFWALVGLSILCLLSGRFRSVLLRHEADLWLPLGLTLFWFIFYLFFVRFHVFCALFLCVALPLLLGYIYKKLPLFSYSRTWLIFLVVVIFTREFYISGRLRRRYPEHFLRETAQLIRWLRQADISGRVALADLSLSPLLKGYCHAAIIVQPKFELAKTRKNVKEYVNLMFHGSEKEFAAYCAKHQVELMIFTHGTTGPLHPRSYRYMANAKKLRPDSVAWLMDRNQQRLRHFFPVSPPIKMPDISTRYQVFRFITPQQKTQAACSAELALQSLREGKRELAARLALAAWRIDPLSPATYLAYYKAYGTPPKLAPGDGLFVRAQSK